MADEASWDRLYRELLESGEDTAGVIYLALGAASACWTNLDGAGTFESTRASILGRALLEELEKRKS